MLPQHILQFITNGNEVADTVRQIKCAVAGGCRWIQIRMKDTDTHAIEKVLEEVKPLCDQTEAKIIMNDRVDIAAYYKLAGVHLGNDDMCVQEARQILGDDAIIGVTANTIEEILELFQQPMSYFGIGPMRYTTTKKNLRPLIGLSGYHDIVTAMRETGVYKPAVAVGGIELSDVYDLLDLGLWGVAVSGAIAKADNIEKATRDFVEAVNKFDDRP